MSIATLIALVQLSLATAVSDGGSTLTAAELNLQLSENNDLSIFEEASGEDGSVTFMKGSLTSESAFSPDIDVQCSADYIDVAVEFQDVYDGIIYSKGFLNDSSCIYVSFGGSESRYSFRVPLNGCGSRPLCHACGTIDNVLVFQADELTRKVSCASTSLELLGTGLKDDTHTLNLKPFMVDMLNVVAVQGPAGGVESWMDIQRGVFPNTTPLKESKKIGEYLTILVYLKDARNQLSLKIHDCWAYDNENYDSPKTNKIQLTDKEGCPKKQKLIDFWQKTTNTGKSSATLIAYNKVRAFRFPGTDQVYLTCNVELCTKNYCDDNCKGINQKITTIMPPQTCYPGSNDPRCRQTTVPQIKCYPGSNDQICPRVEQPLSAAPNCDLGSTDLRCLKPKTHTHPNCYPGSTDSRCPKPTMTAPPNSYPGSTDPIRPKPTVTVPVNGYPGTTDPRRLKYRAVVTAPRNNIPVPAPAVCSPANHPRCQKPKTPAPTTVRYTTTTQSTTQLTLAPLKCSPGSTDPRCPKPTTPAPPMCYPGTTDPRCPKPTTPTLPNCYPGNTDSRCPKPPSLPIQTTQRPSPTPSSCYPGSRDPQCLQPFAPSSTNPPSTYLPPFPTKNTNETPLRYKQTNEAPSRCYPGSTDPRCPKPTSQRPSPTPSSCYPGSRDPECPQPFAPSSTNAPSTYLPPFPAENEVQPSWNARVTSNAIDYYDDNPAVRFKNAIRNIFQV